VRALLAAALLLAAAAAAPAQEAAPPDLAASVRRQDALMERGDGEKAIEEARARLAREPGSPDALYLLGRVLGNSGKVEEARVQFEAALEADPRHAPSWRGMALCHLQREDRDRALEEARRAFEIGRDAESLQILVHVLFARGERPAAYRLLEEEIGKSPKDTRLRRVLAGLHFQEGNFREGEKELRQVLAVEPDDAEVRSMLATALVRMGRQEEAIAECREALRRKPRDVRMLRRLYMLHIDRKELAEAASVMEKVLECDIAPEQRTQIQETLKELRMAVANGPAPEAEADPKDLAEKLDSPDPAVRREAMRVVWEQGFRGAKVLRMVLDGDETVRTYAVKVIGRNRVPGTASVLEALLYAPAKPEPSAVVRAQAALALGEIGDPAVLPVLVRCVAEEADGEVLRSALLALRKVTGKSFAEDPEAPLPEEGRAKVREACRAWWSDHPTGKLWRRKAAAAAGDLKEPSLARYCVPWVSEDDPAMRAAALDALARLTGDASWRESPTETAEQRIAVLERALALLKAD